MRASEDDYLKKVISLSAIFLLLLLLGVYDVFYNYRALTQQPMFPSSTAAFVLEVKPNTSAKELVQQLSALQIVRSRYVLLALIRWYGLAPHLQTGFYQVFPHETVLHLLQRIARGDVLIQTFRIPEGSTLFDLQAQLKTSAYLKHPRVNWAIYAGNHLSAEGLFLAETYHYKAGSAASQLLNQAHQVLLKRLDAIWRGRDFNLPYKTPYELLIAASIIEKEASLPVERRLISGVIVNRLKLKMPLQMDPTVVYALKYANPLSARHSIVLHHEDLKIKSPYNTYTKRGLPITPIAMVGQESLMAAAHPEISSYLYFYAKGDGSHQFSKTYQAQQKAIQQFRRTRVSQ